MKTKILLLFVGCAIHLQAAAQEPGSAYIKNTGDDRVHVWINGSYQGYIKPGETRLTVSDGFITNDSGDGHDGKPVKESHAGWENNSKDKVTITYQFENGEKKTSVESVNERGELIYGVTNKEGAKPEVPSDEDRENAPAIIKGHMPNLKSAKNKDDKERREGPEKGLLGTWQFGKNGSYVIRFDTDKKLYLTISGFQQRGTFSVNGNTISFRMTEKALPSGNWSDPYADGQAGTITTLPDGALEYKGVRYMKK